MAGPVDEPGFLSRWSRRKREIAKGGSADAPPVKAVPAIVPPTAPTQAPPPAAALTKDSPTEVTPAAPPPAADPLPTLDDVAELTPASDFSRFVRAGVDQDVQRAAMKKLFSDPHFNVMDGLDTYIDDYGQPDPIPLAMLRQMNQSKLLGLFDHEEAEPAAGPASRENAPPVRAEPPAQPLPAADPTDTGLPEPETTPTDDDADLRLQQDDAAGRPGPGQGPGP